MGHFQERLKQEFGATEERPGRSRTVLPLVFALSVFAVDFLTPRGMADGILYTLIILLTLYAGRASTTWFTAGLSIVLTLAGFAASPEVGVPLHVAVLNRVLSVFAIAVTAVLGVRLLSANQRLRKQGEELTHANAELRAQVNMDALTGLANRRHFDRRMAEEARRAARAGDTLAVVMLDVDFFKRYNDLKGHVAGDDCLIRIAGAMNACLRRPADFAARYGGEEFAAVLPGTDLAGAEARAEAIRLAVIAAGIPHPDSAVNSYVTVSLGVAAGYTGEDPGPLVRAADKALYLAKQSGRNCTRSVTGEPLPSG